MCAAAISMLKIERVVYGCPNDKFGGNGSIMHFHEHQGSDDLKWHGYDVLSGVKKDEAIQLFKQFYARSNERAPVPKRRKDAPS